MDTTTINKNKTNQNHKTNGERVPLTDSLKSIKPQPKRING